MNSSGIRLFCAAVVVILLFPASGLARRIAGVEEEEFKGDVTDACVLDRGNGEYQVGCG